MDYTDPKRYADGRYVDGRYADAGYTDASWTPRTPRTPSQHQLELHDMSIGGSSPRSDGYYLTPPLPKQQYVEEQYVTPASPIGFSAAPELAEPYPYPHDKRPLSPSSGGGTTLFSPTIPPLNLNDKEAVPQPDPIPVKEPRRCGVRRRLCNIILIIAAILILVLGLSLGLGLGLGLKKDKSPSETGLPFCKSHPELCIGGVLDEKYYSKKGAFNGSGIALAGESWNRNQRKIFTLYFQHWTGDIRFMQYGPDQKWIGGEKAQTVTTDAKNSTPISAVAYSINSTQYFHLFYITRNNTLKQITQTNVTNIWESGPLTKLNLSVFDSPSAGLQACWKGNFYGDSDYSRFPTPNGVANEIPFEQRLGMNIWFAIDDSTFQQYAWYNGKDDWVALDKWQGKSGYAGVGCYSWGPGTTTYAMMVSRDNDTEIWWKDTNTTMTSEDYHPINSWVNSTEGAIGDIYPASSLGFTTYLYMQSADRSVRGYNVTYDAENTTIVAEDTFTISDPAGPVLGLGGTHLSVTAYAELDGNETVWDSLYVFYQTEGDDITAFTRPIKGGEWSSAPIPIPQD